MGQVVSFIVSVAYVCRFKTIKVEKSDLKLSGKICGNILILGVSSFITQIVITVVMILFNNLLKNYGAQSEYGSEIPLTALGIVMKVNQIMLSILVGIAIGAQPVIGYNYGCKNGHRVKKAFILYEIGKLKHHVKLESGYGIQVAEDDKKEEHGTGDAAVDTAEE